jgi:hypothetical protein
MIKSRSKVSVEQIDETTLITISPKIEQWQVASLGIWIVVWLFCGMFVLLSFLKGVPQEQQIFYLVFMGFWAYFLFYATRSFIWNRMGAEHIRLSNNFLDYKRAYGNYGRVISYDLENIKNLGKVNYEDKTWAKIYNDAFWTIGGETLGFEYLGKKVGLGFKMEESQVKKLLKQISIASQKAKITDK